MKLVDNSRIIACQSSKKFWAGWLAGSAIIAGGKLWIVITKAEARVSQTVGYIGKPVFRRQLAVGCAVLQLSSCLFCYLGDQFLDKDLCQRNIYHLTTNTVSILLAVTSAVILTHPAYRLLFYAVSLYSLFELAVYSLHVLKKIW